MPGKIAKCTFFVRYKQAGCSFSLFRDVTELSELTVVEPKTNDSILDRFTDSYCKLLGKDVELPYVRISNESLKGDSEYYDKPRKGIGGGVVDGGSAKTRLVKVAGEDYSDLHNTALNVTLYSSSTKKGRMFMRFIPDDVYNNPVGTNPPPGWDKQFNSWAKLLKDDGWCVMALKDHVEAPEKKIKQIIRGASGDNLKVITDGAHGIAEGKTVRISRSLAETTFKNGIFIVETATGSEMTLRNTPGAQLLVATKGTVRLHEKSLAPIQKAAYRDTTSRKAGRPFGVPVGRRKVSR